jgi:hypothetical protein
MVDGMIQKTFALRPETEKLLGNLRHLRSETKEALIGLAVDAMRVDLSQPDLSLRSGSAVNSYRVMLFYSGFKDILAAREEAKNAAYAAVHISPDAVERDAVPDSSRLNVKLIATRRAKKIRGLKSQSEDAEGIISTVAWFAAIEKNIDRRIAEDISRDFGQMAMTIAAGNLCNDAVLRSQDKDVRLISARIELWRMNIGVAASYYNVIYSYCPGHPPEVGGQLRMLEPAPAPKDPIKHRR